MLLWGFESPMTHQIIFRLYCNVVSPSQSKTDMKLFIDTEFDQGNQQLISLAIISECGKKFYAARKTPVKVKDWWIKKNVLKKLKTVRLKRPEFNDLLTQFLVGFDQVEVVSDSNEDVKYFTSALEEIGMATSLKVVFEVFNKQKIKRKGVTVYESALKHNALADAEANMLTYTSWDMWRKFNAAINACTEWKPSV